MKCPKCENEIDLIRALQENAENFKAVPAGDPIMLNAVCKNCNDGGVWIELIPYTENKELFDLPVESGGEKEMPLSERVRVEETNKNGQE